MLAELLALLQAQLDSVAQLSHACKLLSVFTAALPTLAEAALQQAAAQPDATASGHATSSHGDDSGSSHGCDTGHLQMPEPGSTCTSPGSAACGVQHAARQPKLDAAPVSAWLDSGQPASHQALHFVAATAVPALARAALLVDPRLGGTQ